MSEHGLGFGRTRIVKGHGLYVRLPLAERLRAARGMKQAIVKVSSFAHGIKGVNKLMAYISREGNLPLETESGTLIKDREAQRELVRDWAIDFDKRKDSRDSAHIVFSMPPGSDPEALRRSIRTVGAQAFPGHEWVFAIHQDKNHPHAHMVLKMRGREQDLKLDLKKADLHELRGIFAEAAREQGVMLAASPRAARGVGRKGVRRSVYQLRAKGKVPQVHELAARELEEEVKRGDWQEKPWEKSMRLRHEIEKQAYLEDAQTLRTVATREEVKDRMVFLKAVRELEQFSRIMPTPRTRRMAWLEKFRKAAGLKVPERGKSKDMGWER